MKHKTGAAALIFFLYAAAGAAGADDTLDKAVEQQARYIIKTVPRDTVAAIVSVTSGSALLSDYVMEKLPDFVVDNKEQITFVDRSRLDLAQKEIDFQYSGAVSDETMVSIGKKLGARVIITGAIMEAGKSYNFSVKLLDVESAKLLGSNSARIAHDETMDGFLSDSRLARAALEEARQKRAKRDAAVTTLKRALGIFSDGFYLGYLGSLNMPVGLSFGTIREGAGFFLETGFGPPRFGGHEHSNTMSHNGNSLKNTNDGFTYKNEREKTAFLWDLTAGVNINIIKTLLWATAGCGFEYKNSYTLFTETSADDSYKIWIQNETDGPFKFLLSAGLYVKIWYFYLKGTYKYVVGEELDSASYGMRHLGLGAGYVWRR